MEAAETELSVSISRVWLAIGVFSMLVVLAVWLRKRSFRWFRIPLAVVPYFGPLFFASPATGCSRNRTTRRARTQ